MHAVQPLAIWKRLALGHLFMVRISTRCTCSSLESDDTDIGYRLCPWFLQQPGWLLRLGTSGPCVGHLKKPLKRCSVRVEDTSWMSRKQARIVWSMFATQQTIGILIGICSLCPASTWRLLAAHLARLKHLRLCSHMAWRHGAHSLGRCRLKKTSPPEL